VAVEDGHRRVSARYVHSASSSINAATPFKYTTLQEDTHSAYNISTGVYTCKVKGEYRYSASISAASVAQAAGSSISLSFQKNGTTIKASVFRIVAAISNTFFHSGTGTVSLNPGDTFEVDTDSTAAATCITDATFNSFEIERIGGAAAVLASEKVICQVTGDAASATTTNPIIFPTVTFSTHGNYNATTGEYTVNGTGYWKVYGALASASGAVILEIYVDGVSRVRAGTSDSNGEATINASVYVTNGQKLTLRPNGGTFDATSASVITFEKL